MRAEAKRRRKGEDGEGQKGCLVAGAEGFMVTAKRWGCNS